jgi:hypothetical protein
MFTATNHKGNKSLKLPNKETKYSLDEWNRVQRFCHQLYPGHNPKLWAYGEKLM